MRDRHHIINPRAEWTLRPAGREIRNTQSLIPRIDREIHEAIHDECPPVPLLCYNALKLTVQKFEPVHNTLKDMDNLMSAIEQATRHPRTHPIERDLAGLAIEAIDLQRPYIMEGLIR